MSRIPIISPFILWKKNVKEVQFRNFIEILNYFAIFCFVASKWWHVSNLYISYFLNLKGVYYEQDGLLCHRQRKSKPDQSTRVVCSKEQEYERYLPIWIGLYEAEAITIACSILRWPGRKRMT